MGLRDSIIMVITAVVGVLLVVGQLSLRAVNRRKAFAKLLAICQMLDLRPIKLKYISASYVGEYRGARVVVFTQPTGGSLPPRVMRDAIFLVMDTGSYPDMATPNIPPTFTDPLPKTMQLRAGGKSIFKGGHLDLIMCAAWGEPWSGLHIIASPGVFSVEAFRTTFDRMYQECRRLQGSRVK